MFQARGALKTKQKREDEFKGCRKQRDFKIISI